MANAAVLITIERINDQEALITGLGSLNFIAPPIDRDVLALVDPFATDPVSGAAVNVLSSSSMTVGASP